MACDGGGREVVFVSAVRTPVGNFGGSLRDIPAPSLGAHVIHNALVTANCRPVPSQDILDLAPSAFHPSGGGGDHCCLLEHQLLDTIASDSSFCCCPHCTSPFSWNPDSIPINVDEVVMGHAIQAGVGQNSARQASLYAGLPKETPAYSVNMICASGLKAIQLAAQSIMIGDAEIVVAGGMESMSNVPYALPKARWGYRMDLTGHGPCTDLLIHDGLWEKFYGYHMAETAENIVKKYELNRHDQDELGFLSHERACRAIQEGHFRSEVSVVSLPTRRGPPLLFDTDEHPMKTSIGRMSALKPVFNKAGTITAGNAAGINDAAAAVLMMSSEKAQELNLTPLAKLKACAAGGVDPAYTGIGVIPAVKKVLKNTRRSISDMQTIEINEAFAAQALACMLELNVDETQVNIDGSGISIGHPVGCTGARMVVTALHQMNRVNSKQGLVAMCVGGGQGLAAILSR